MFDQISLGSAGGPTVPDASNLPNLNQGKPYPFKKVGEPEDIFGDTEKLGGGRVERPSNPINPMAMPNVREPGAAPVIQTAPMAPRGPSLMASSAGTNGRGGNKILTATIIILAVVAIGLLGWWAYGKYLAKETTPADTNLENSLQNLNDNLQNLKQENNEVTVPEQETPAEEVIVPTTTEELTIDSDGDGLTDAEEAKLGTNANRVDSDFDGLSDYDEVKKWETNPLNPDTDGDTYLDGVEAQNGYNPLGSGKLMP